MERGIGEAWLINFTRKLREMLPKHIISHAPQAPYFYNNIETDKYPKGAYLKVDKEVGDLIDFYTVQFYNQGDTTYDTYETLFIKSNGWFPGTSVKEMIANGVPSEKIVVGKPVTKEDVFNTGLMDLNKLGEAVTKAYKELGWYAGVMFWQYSSDINGTAIKTAANNLK
eukprot:GHVR01055355.1.p1 GENE.GHVR01055355.1~~GHVR01055355.1.p1  ORF type:complete len:169 (+),score=14.26 GHVR01055355.1:532-1038(+)